MVRFLGKTKNIFLLVFVLVSLAQIIGEVRHSAYLTIIFKPLLMPSLAVFAMYQAKDMAQSVPWLLLAALFFSWIGDVVLMFAGFSEWFFIGGLCAFLIGHLFYIALNLKSRAKIPFRIELLISASPMLLVAILMVTQISARVPAMALPICAYAIVLCLLYFTGLLAKPASVTVEWIVLFLGIVLFIASDTIIAINRFIFQFDGAGVMIMTSYITAQYLLVMGNLAKPKIKIAQQSL